MTRAALIAVWLLVLLPSSSFAQDPEPAPKTEAKTETVEPKDSDRPAKEEDASADVFIPTEEISEDASVPFPVDI